MPTFLDTNVLLYAVDEEDRRKYERASGGRLKSNYLSVLRAGKVASPGCDKPVGHPPRR